MGEQETSQVPRPTGCAMCSERGKGAFTLPIRMAFQPIVNLSDGNIFAYEALVRGPNGEGAAHVISQVTDDNRYAFDQLCRVKAVETAARLDRSARISINFMPNAVYNPENCIQTTLWAASEYDFPLENIIFEFTESEQISNTDHLNAIIAEYHRHGFKTAIDDFGAGYAGLSRLAGLSPDLIKIDMGLVRDIDTNDRKRILVDAICDVCEKLGVRVIAEGVETQAELEALAGFGIDLIQGYLLARPELEAFTTFDQIMTQRAA